MCAAYYFLGTDYLEQRREVKAMTSRAVEAAQMLAQIPPSPAGLAERLSEAQESYETALGAFPDPISTTGIIDNVLKLADAAGVKAIPLITQPWATEEIGGQEYAVFRLSVTATGNYSNLADFIDRMETDTPPTLVIESMVIERATDTEEQVEPFEAKLELAVYARPAAGDGTGGAGE